MDTKKENIAIKEGVKLGIPIVAMVDSNGEPEDIDYVIPSNDDAIRSIRLLTSVIADACVEGHNEREEKLKAEEELEIKRKADIEQEKEDKIQPSEEEDTEGPDIIIIPKRSKTAQPAETDDPEPAQTEI